MLRAVLFDFNGVLVDDEPIHFELVRRVLVEEGLALQTEDYLAEYVGLSDSACFAAVLAAAGEEPDEARITHLVARKANFYRQTMERQGFPFFPGALDLVRSTRAAGLMLGVVSGALRGEVEAALDQVELRSAFKCLVAAEDVAKSKPDPEGYLQALDRLNSVPPLPNRLIHPHEVLAIEDTPRGLEAAVAAGLVTLGIAQTFARESLADADFIAEGLGGLGFEDLQRLYAEVSRR